MNPAWLDELIEAVRAWEADCRALPRVDWASHIALCNAIFPDPARKDNDCSVSD